MVAMPNWLAIVDDEIKLWLNPSVLAQIELDTHGLADKNEIIYRVNSQELLQVLASSVGMAAQRQGAIVIWTYYSDNTVGLPEAEQQLILRTTDKPILDYNPSDEFHFIYDKIIFKHSSRP